MDYSSGILGLRKLFSTGHEGGSEIVGGTREVRKYRISLDRVGR